MCELNTPPVGKLAKVRKEEKLNEDLDFLMSNMSIDAAPRDEDAPGAPVTMELYSPGVEEVLEESADLSRAVCATAIIDAPTRSDSRPSPVTMERVSRNMLCARMSEWMLSDMEYDLSEYNQNWDPRGTQDEVKTWKDTRHTSKKMWEENKPDTDKMVMDLRWTTGLRNAVMHFKVPRNRIIRERCLAPLRGPKRAKLEEEEEARRCKREKLSTIDFAKYFDEKEREQALLWKKGHLQNGWKDTSSHQWRKWGASGKRRRRTRSASPLRKIRRDYSRRSTADKEDLMKFSTDQRGFPKPKHAIPKSTYRGGARPAFTYDELGEGRNFFVFAADSNNWRGERYVYTVFPKSGSVVVTGLRTMPDVRQYRLVEHLRAEDKDRIPSAIVTFCNITDLPLREIKDVKVTNSTWSGSLLPAEKVPVQLGSVMEVLSNYSDWLTTEGSELAHQVSISFRSQFFPGARLQHLRLKGTINLFNNGSFVIVGVEKACQVRKLLLWISAIMNAHWKNPLGGKSCAWTAE
jgi:hypothetical protein